MDFMSFLEKNESKPWDWYGVSRNPNITMEFIDAHPEKDWDWRGISFHKFGWANTRSYWNIRRSKTIDQTSLIKEEFLARIHDLMKID